MKRLAILLAATIAALLIGGARAPVASAALTCPSFSVGQPTWNSNSDLAVSWGARCSGNQWGIEVMLQYEVGGVWHYANCAGSSPCRILRPNDGSLFASGSTHSGTVTFNPLNGCELRWRGILLIDTATGNQLGPFAGIPNHTC